MKYKVGDKVRIKNLDWYNECKDEFGDIECGDAIMNIKKSQFCGKIVTISSISDVMDTYKIKEDNRQHIWTDEMIEGLVEDETKPKFKVGDRIITNKGYIGTFEGWVSDYQVRVLFPESGCNVVIHPKNLKLAKDESNIDLTVKGEEVKESIEITIPEGYEYVIESSKIIFTKKKKEYPKTYEECINILGGAAIIDIITYYYEKQLKALYKLLICRDAYWKIAGEEMGLNRPWEPDWKNQELPKYCIAGVEGQIKTAERYIVNTILAFPTAEMRDAFYEVFREEIEICKEFL